MFFLLARKWQILFFWCAIFLYAIWRKTALLELVAEAAPDVVVMDIGMPGMNGIEATQQLRTERPETRVIVLSGYSDKRFVLEALNAGAAGYVIKASAADELPRAIRAVAKGKTYLCPEVASAVVDLARARQRPVARR